MAASPANALSRAQERVRRTLFPIRSDKWLHLGFIAFLAALGEGGGASQLVQLPGSVPRGPGAVDDLRQALEVLLAQAAGHWPAIAALAAVFVVLSVSVAVLLLWVSSRGKVMFVEAVVHDRWAVAEPWSRLREPAASLFKARLAAAALGAVLSLGVMAIAIAVAWPDLRAWRFDASAMAGVLIASSLLLLLPPIGFFLELLDDFLLPVMYLDGLSVTQALEAFRRKIAAGQLSAIALFYFAKFAIGLVIGFVTVLALCFTCCLVALPYVGTVVLLPLHVFLRAFSLSFLEELGKPVFPREVPGDGWSPTDRFGGAPPR